MELQRISADELRTRFTGEGEFAIIDTREEGAFTRAHLLAASNLPLSRIELLIEEAVPRVQTEIILCDEGTAQRARRTLHDFGYENLVLLAGGLSGWSLNGGKLFSGVNVPGKETAMITAPWTLCPAILRTRPSACQYCALDPLLFFAQSASRLQLGSMCRAR